MSKQPTHFAVEDITFYAMDEDNEIITDEKGEELRYRLKDNVRFKPLEYITDDLSIDELEPIKENYEDNFDQGDIRDHFKKATIVKESK